MPPRPTPVARRTTLGAALVGLVAVGGCDLEDLDPRSEPAPVTPTTSAPPEDADVDLVEAVVTDLSAALGAASALRGADRATGRAFTRLHRRHLTELDAADEVITAGGPDRLAAVLRTERRLQRRLAEAAVAAESGELAAVLASMSAAVAQLLATAPAQEA